MRELEIYRHLANAREVLLYKSETVEWLWWVIENIDDAISFIVEDLSCENHDDE